MIIISLQHQTNSWFLVLNSASTSISTCLLRHASEKGSYYLVLECPSAYFKIELLEITIYGFIKGNSIT